MGGGSPFLMPIAWHIAWHYVKGMDGKDLALRYAKQLAKLWA